MNPDEATRKIDSPPDTEDALEATDVADATSESIDRLIGRVKEYTPPPHLDEPACRELVESLQKLSFDLPRDLADPHARIGGRIDEYRLVRLLGRGGMGEVYYAEHQRLGRGFALKLLHRNLIGNELASSRFEREMKTIGQLDHENIVRATGAGEVDGDLFLVMEYVEGEPVSEILKQAPAGRLTVPQACDIIAQACAGLLYAHERGIVHRDIKPANLMQDRSGRVRILDLGLARLKKLGERDDELTRMGQSMGTVDYMSPEQLRDSRNVDARSDVYSLGATFYKLLTGRAPFADDSHPTVESRVMAIAHEEIPLIRSQAPDVPTPIAELIHQMLARNPDERPQSIAEVAGRLQAYRQPAVDDSSPRIQPAPSARRVRGPAAWIAAVAVLGLIGLASIVIYLRDPGQGDLVITAAEDVAITIRESNGDVRTLQLIKGANQPIEVRTGKFEITFDGANADRFDWDDGGRELVMRAGDEFRASIVRKAILNGGVPQDVSQGVPAAPVVLARSAFDDLRPEQIGSLELKHAGRGDPSLAPTELVAVFGDSQMKLNSNINSISLDAAGRTVAAASDLEVVVWNQQTGEEVYYYAAQPTESIGASALSPDGTRLAAWTSPAGIKIWEVATSREFQLLPDVTGYVTLLRFSSDGQRIAAGFSDGAIRVWEVQTGRESLSVPATDGGILAVAFSPDFGSAALVRHDATIAVIDLTSGEERFALQTGSPPNLWLAVDLNEHFLAYVDYDTVHLCDPGTGKEVRKFSKRTQGLTSVVAAALSPDGKRIACPTLPSESQIRIFDTESGTQLHQLDGHAQSFYRMAFSTDGKTLATGGGDNTLALWDVETGTQRLPATGRTGAMVAVDVSRNGQLLACGYRNGTVELYGVADRQLRQLLDTTRGAASTTWPALTDVEFSPDGTNVAACYGGRITLWECATGEQQQSLSVAGSGWGIAFSPAGDRLACTNNTGLQVFDLTTGRSLKSISPEDQLASVEFSPDGELIAAAGEKFLYVWNAGSGDLLQREPATVYSRSTCSLAFSPDGTLMTFLQHPAEVGAEAQSRAVLLDLASNANSPIDQNFLGGCIVSLAFSPSGTDVAVFNSRGLIEVSTRSRGVGSDAWKRQQTIPAVPVLQVTYTPDGRHLVTAHANGTASVYRLGGTTPNGANASNGPHDD